MNQSVIKALKLLDFFTEQPELSLSDIAKLSKMSKPTAYRLLTALETSGFLQRIRYSDLDIRYRLGMKLLELGNIVSDQLELRKVALVHMQSLRDKVGEVVHLVILDGDEAVYIEKVESHHAMRLYTRIGKRSPLHAGSGPKLLLAFLEESERERILNGPLVALTEQTIVDRDRLRAELATIRRYGFAVSDGEQDLDTGGISFPIRDFRGQVVAALGISGLNSHLFGEQEEFMKEQTRLAAKRISKDLGAS